MSYPPSRYAKNVIVLPSGDHVGCRASLKRSVIRFAAPPLDGSVQMLPCMSMASIRPSGETATDIEVPSCTVTLMNGEEAGAAPCAATIVRLASTTTDCDIESSGRHSIPPISEGLIVEASLQRRDQHADAPVRGPHDVH